MAKYGFSSVNRTVNPSINNKNDAEINRLRGAIISTGRVVSVITDTADPSLVGTIEYVDMETHPGDVSTNAPSVLRLKAKPLFTNVKNYPLVNELVLLIRQPNINIKSTTAAKSVYYLNVLSLWNHPHHNAIPYSQGQNQSTQAKTLSQITAGSVVNTTDQSSDITFGDTFLERNTINPLKPFEGDVIYEGRWGHSIRFGSTVKTIQNQTPLNDWSKGTSTSGDPILILRNGQGPDVGNGFDYITEDINTDLGSIYFGSTQQIPLNASSTSYVSYKTNPPTIPNQYSGKQIIINSGRLVFNSSEDHILFSSKKSINLNAVESVNIDAPSTVIQSENVYLGSKNATEPLLLGNQTVNLLNQLITNLSGFMTICSTVVSSPPGQPIPQLNLAATQVNSSLQALQANLDLLKSKYNYTV
jgi:hypothetical protein